MGAFTRQDGRCSGGVEELAAFGGPGWFGGKRFFECHGVCVCMAVESPALARCEVPDGDDTGVWLLESEVGTALIESGPFCEGSRHPIRVKDRVWVVYQEDLDRLVAQASADDSPLDPYPSCGCPEVAR